MKQHQIHFYLLVKYILQMVFFNYRLHYTNHPHSTAHGSSAVLIKEAVEHYELLQYE